MNAYRYGAWWRNNNVRVVLMEETDELAFYLQANDDNALRNEQNFIQEIMNRLHDDKKIQSTLIHVFRRIDKDSGKVFSAEYPNDHLWILKDTMKVNRLPLPSIKEVLSVSDILTGYTKKTYRERESDMNRTTTIVHGDQILGNQTKDDHSSVAKVINSSVDGGSVTVTTKQETPSKKPFWKTVGEKVAVKVILWILGILALIAIGILMDSLDWGEILDSITNS